MRDFSGSTPLHNVVRLGDQNQLEILSRFKKGAYPTNLDVQDVFGNTALHLAVLLNNFEAARILIESGADVSVLNAEALTPLALAKANNLTEIIQMMLQKLVET